MSLNRKGKNRPLVALGAAVSILGLSLYLYRRYATDFSDTRRRDDDDGTGSRGESSKTANKVSCMSMFNSFLVWIELNKISRKFLQFVSTSQLYR
jgi:hypothetical protein